MTKKPKRKNFSHFICYFYQRRIIESSEKQLVNYPILSVTRIKLNDMRKYFLYACLLFAGVFTACDNDDSDGIDPSIPFYQNLGVEYNVTQNHTHIGANFNKYNSEGANLRLPAKGILFNGKVPDFLGMGAYMYMLSSAGHVHLFPLERPGLYKQGLYRRCRSNRSSRIPDIRQRQWRNHYHLGRKADREGRVCPGAPDLQRRCL